MIRRSSPSHPRPEEHAVGPRTEDADGFGLEVLGIEAAPVAVEAGRTAPEPIDGPVTPPTGPRTVGRQMPVVDASAGLWSV